jgi:hypothetical protein
VILTYQALAESVSTDDVLEEVLAAVPAPGIEIGRAAVA